jgi:hypothetical protein
MEPEYSGSLSQWPPGITPERLLAIGRARLLPHPGGRRATTDDARVSGLRRNRSSHVLCSKLPGPVPARRRLCRQDSARDEAGQHPRRIADALHMSANGRFLLQKRDQISFGCTRDFGGDGGRRSPEHPAQRTGSLRQPAVAEQSRFMSEAVYF